MGGDERYSSEGGTDETGQFVGGNAALDERFFVRYYDAPAATVGPVGNNLHGADEHITIPSLLDTSDDRPVFRRLHRRRVSRRCRSFSVS